MKKYTISQAVILAAGQGKRMGKLTSHLPKPMLRVNKKPLLEYTLEKLPKQIKEIILVVGYLQKQIKNYFGQSFSGKKITYVEQERLLGTGQALFICEKFLKEKFLVMMGDDIYTAQDIQRLLAYDRAMLVFPVAADWKPNGVFGAIQANSNHNLIGIRETKLKPGESGLINTALYVLDQHIFNCQLQPINSKEFGLPQTMLKLPRKYPIKIVKTKFWQPVGTPEQFEIAKNILF